MSGDVLSQRFAGYIQRFDPSQELFPAHGDGGEPITMGDMAATLGQYILSATASKGLIKQTELKRIYKVDETTFNTVLKYVTQNLEDAFGYRLCAEGTTSYVVVNTLKSEPHDAESILQRDARRGFLSVLLGFVLMERHPCLGDAYGKVSAEKIWKFLNELEISERQASAQLGDVKAMIAAFVKEGWLSSVKEIDGKVLGDDVHYEWGIKARESVLPLAAFRAFCKITSCPNGKKMWKLHYQHIKQMDIDFRKAHKLGRDPELSDDEDDENDKEEERRQRQKRRDERAGQASQSQSSQNLASQSQRT